MIRMIYKKDRKTPSVLVCKHGNTAEVINLDSKKDIVQHFRCNQLGVWAPTGDTTEEEDVHTTAARLQKESKPWDALVHALKNEGMI